MEAQPERRKVVRQSLKLNKIFPVEWRSASRVRRFYLSVLDISEAGMRAKTHVFLPLDEAIHLRFLTDPPLELRFRAVWDLRQGAAQVAGGQFVDLTPETVENLRKFIDRNSVRGKRRTFRLECVLQVHIEGSTPSTVQTLDLSSEGVRIASPSAITDSTVTCTIHLTDTEDIKVRARVVWQRDCGGHFMAGLEFVDPTLQTEQSIDQFIDRELSRILEESERADEPYLA